MDRVSPDALSIEASSAASVASTIEKIRSLNVDLMTVAQRPSIDRDLDADEQRLLDEAIGKLFDLSKHHFARKWRRDHNVQEQLPV